MAHCVTIQNNSTIAVKAIPVLKYDDFLEVNLKSMDQANHHCVNYFGYADRGILKLVCCVANDDSSSILVSGSEVSLDTNQNFRSFTAANLSFHSFERELHENYGINYFDHPWLKPVRFSFNRVNQEQTIDKYPFFQIKSEELHEIGVGPIHAGIIEPGHFRFLCNGEQILHLEIQLGYQHRGVENHFLKKRQLLQRTILAESIAGDMVAGHATAFANLWECLCGFHTAEDILFARAIALELERIAVHTGDLSAICNDIGYQLGSAVFGRLRTPVINFFQEWCGNRLAKGLIRPGQNRYPFSQTLCDKLEALFDDYESDFDEIWEEFHSLPSALSRLEKTGVVSAALASSIGTVGMTARASGLLRDVRLSHPFGVYNLLSPITVIKHHGDVYSRTKIRHDEIIQSIYYLRNIVRRSRSSPSVPNGLASPKAGSFGISLVEGWRGEICHSAVTDENGDLLYYKIKDPSMHNWLAVALSVRNNEISDYPVCNKSFDLSYCGHDL